MIYHKWKLIFVGIPKNASTSFHMALTNRTDYWEVGHNHRTIFEDFHNNDEDLLLYYDSMCVIRNPYDRFFSAWKFANPHKGPVNMSDYKNAFNEFVLQSIDPNFRELNMNHEHWYPQYKFVTMNKRIVVDEILKYETLHKDWENFQEKWNRKRNLPYKMNLNLPHENSSQTTVNWQEVYDTESREIVYDFYRRDFNIFNYQK